MNEEIIELAREAGFGGGLLPWPGVPENFKRFHDLAIAAEHKRLLAGSGEPYAWHYTTISGATVLHVTRSIKLTADIEAAATYPQAHRVETIYTAEQMAAAVLRATLAERERCAAECDKVLGENAISAAIRGMQ